MFFFFNDTATTEIYTLSLHDALPISIPEFRQKLRHVPLDLDHPVWVDDEDFDIDRHVHRLALPAPGGPEEDRKSTRLNSSHANISYAVFCLKKKKPYNTGND